MINQTAFVVIAGNPTKWDREMRERVVPGDESLVAMQVSQHARGRRTAQLTNTIYGWSVRAGSGLDSFRVLAGTRRGEHISGSLQAALHWGIAWAEQDPDNREFIAHRAEVPGYLEGCEQVKIRRAKGEQE